MLISKKAVFLSHNPERTYKNKGWISWNDWLDHGYIATQLRE